jgi:hypothetical protein
LKPPNISVKNFNIFPKKASKNLGASRAAEFQRPYRPKIQHISIAPFLSAPERAHNLKKSALRDTTERFFQ